ncbi:MAG: enoyl-CoA hydratase/isomerase family protein [Balneola sp.]|nr:MAG: enoyl-CoA hydratase/isomerase family protein [Balneola sp.]
MEGSVHLSIQDGIGTIEFFHPKGNSLPGALLQQLSDAITTAGESSDISVIILRSKGDGAFCAGASFDELIAIEDAETGRAFFSGFGRVITAMISCPKFIITRVQGKAVGGGVGIIASSDYAIAGKDASVKLSELSIGIGPFVIAPLVQKKLGFTAFATLSINAWEWKNADWAFQNGLYNDIASEKAELDEKIDLLAKRLASSSPEAMRKIKEVMWGDTESLKTLVDQRAKITGLLAQSEFTKAFIRSFKRN